MDIYYQKLQPVHARQYREIRLESLKLYPGHFGSKYEEQKKLKELLFESIIKQEDTQNFVIGAFDKNELIGICAFTERNGYNLMQTGSLIQVYVKKAYSGRKIGLNLVQKTIAEAVKVRDIQKIILEVNKSNYAAIRVYEQAGFEPFNLEAEQDTLDGLLMIRKASLH